MIWKHFLLSDNALSSFLTVTFIVLGLLWFTGFFSFALLSLKEGERRASRVAAAAALLGAPLFFLTTLLSDEIKLGIGTVIAASILIGLLILLIPVGRIKHTHQERKERFDERDVVFARSRLRTQTPEYDAYYTMRPEHQAIDDKVRALPGLLSLSAQKADALVFPASDAGFDMTEALHEEVDGPVSAERIDRSAEALTTFIRGLTTHLGAISVGITELHPGHIYSHIGRGTGVYGAPVTLNHRFGIAFSVEMDHSIMGGAPEAPTVMESAHKYVEAAIIALQLGYLIRSLGYPARAHIDGNYRVIASLVARDAGIGEIGRMGILMTPELGPRVRLGIVTTDLPLIPSKPQVYGSMIDFCRICVKCAENCPSRAISFEDQEEVEGALRWRIDADQCFHYWNVIGTDCGICMAVCPYSHPDNWAHNLIRAFTRHSGAARRIALKMDDLFYGRYPAPRPFPDWVFPGE
jgi:ferredoxin